MTKNIFKSVIILFLVSIFIVINPYQSIAQCGAAPNIQITNYCNNQYACWTITNPSTVPGVIYNWNLTNNFNITNPGASGSNDLGNGTKMCYPGRLSTPTTGTGQVQIYYAIETPNIAIPTPPTLTGNGAKVSTFSMTFTTTSVIQINSVVIPIVIYNAANTFQTQIEIQGTGGAQYSAVYNYLGSSVPTIPGLTGGNPSAGYYLTVPVNLTLSTPGVYAISVVTPTGSNNNIDGYIYTNGAYSGGAYPGLSIGGGVLNPINSGTNSSIIYNWNYNSYCGTYASGYALPTTTGCCTPILSNPGLGAATNIIQSGLQTVTISSSIEFSTVAGYTQWYLNGVSIPGANAIGQNDFFVATTAGVYTARVADDAADINNVSCYAQSSWTLNEQEIFAAITSAPEVGPYCIGNIFTITATTDGSDITWTPASSLSEISPYVVNYTAATLGYTQITVSANIILNDAVVNGDFSSGVINPSSTGLQLTASGDPGQANGGYAIGSIVPSVVNGGGGDDSYWEPCTSSGDFMIINGFQSSSPSSLIWSQTVNNITPGNTYTLSLDITNIAANGSNNNVPSGNANIDVQLQVFINGITVGGVFTSGGDGLLSNVCKWTTLYFTWTAGSSVTQADIQIQQVNLFQGQGLDFALDNIQFGGFTTQSASVTVGPVLDCSSITAFTSSCSGTHLTLTASVSGGMVFDYWANSAGDTISTSSIVSVQTSTPGIFTAYGSLPLTSLDALQFNGTFPTIGYPPQPCLSCYFTSFTYSSSDPPANNYSIVLNGGQTSDGNSTWLNLPSPPGFDPTSNIFVADEHPPINQTIVGFNFNAVAGQEYQFSGYAANLHNYITCTSALCGYDVESGAVAILINNTTITSLNLPRDNNWHGLSAIWTAPTTGSFTLKVIDNSTLFQDGSYGDDVALANLFLIPLYGIKTATVSGPACVLPVTFESFSLRKVYNGISLTWHVTEEINVRDYSVERSNDGVNFASIGSVPYRSASNIGSASSYSFIDSNPIIGTGYYRIREVDLDGYSTLTNIESIDLTNVVNSIVVVPNLVSKGDPITIENHTLDTVYVSVQSLDGKEIDQQTILTPGANTYYTSKLSAGMYLFHFQSNGILSVKKVVVQ